MKETEKEIIKSVLQYAKKYGYGNLIAHLKRDWTLMLMRDYGLKKEIAIEATEVSAYLIKQENK